MPVCVCLCVCVCVFHVLLSTDFQKFVRLCGVMCVILCGSLFEVAIGPLFVRYRKKKINPIGVCLAVINARAAMLAPY